MSRMFRLLVSFLIALLSTVFSYNDAQGGRHVLVVAGNFTINGEVVNIAQYNFRTRRWSTKYHAEVFRYSESNGLILDVAVNESSYPFNTLFTVGSFDTVAKTSQIQFCSVSAFDGITFDKVGEGLCPRGTDSNIEIEVRSAVIGDNGDLFVGGNFETRVWDGHHFVNVYQLALFDRKSHSLDHVSCVLLHVKTDYNFFQKFAYSLQHSNL